MGSQVLALDFGTQGVKAHLMDEKGVICATSRANYGFSVNTGGYMEQNPHEWWSACVQACHDLRDKKPAEYGAVCAVGFSGQMHGPVLLDKAGKPVGACICWCDTRCTVEARDLRGILGDTLQDALLNPPVTSYTAPKLLWLARHCPEQLGCARHVVFCKDYIRYRFCGELATDYSDASGSLLYDFTGDCWSSEAISALGFKRDLFPHILPSVSVCGKVNAGCARELGLRQGTPVATGAGDLACSILGSGISSEDEVLINLGTAGQVLAIRQSLPTRTQGAYAFRFLEKDSAFLLYAVPSAAYCLRWFLENVTRIEAEMAKQQGVSPFALMDKEAAQSPAGSGGLLFAPYLSGTGSPYFDDRARGTFVGLDSGHGKADMTRAILEGVCYGIKDCFESMGSGHQLGTISFSGGGSNSALWRQIMADVLDSDISCPAGSETAGIGAGLIAATTVGIFSDLQQAAATVCAGQRVTPQQDSEVYRRQYLLYRRIYPALKTIFDDHDIS